MHAIKVAKISSKSIFLEPNSTHVWEDSGALGNMIIVRRRLPGDSEKDPSPEEVVDS